MMRKSNHLVAAPPTIKAMASSPLTASYQLSKTTHSGHTYMWGALIIGSLTFVVVSSLCLFFRRRLFPVLSQRYESRAYKGSLKDEKLLLRRFQLVEIVKATNNFSDECLLGSGAFGKVYKGVFEVEGTLAIKTAHADSYQSVEEFRNEVRLLSKVKHRNLIALVGYCEESGIGGAKVLVYEYVPEGSLLEYIMGKRETSLSWRQRVNIAIGAAKGIAHLHDGVTPCIIHRDIKPSNILVGEGFEAKVSDFGLVRIGPTEDKSHVSSQIKGTPGYLDPAYCSSFHLSPLSDVYSFGVILLQLISAGPAVDSNRTHPNYHIIEWARPSLEKGDIREILDVNLLTEPCNMDVMLKMGQLGLRCAVKNPKNRPTMTRVWQELEQALNSADCRSVQSTEHEYSQSFVSIDGIGFQRFHIDIESLSFASANFRCLDASSISFDAENKERNT